jgi:hypothetical protein
MKKPLAWRGGRASVLVGVRTRSARLSKKELLVHGTSIPASAGAALPPGRDLAVRTRAASLT